ncbi:HAD-IC family P-type ATPase [Candidatus Saccharibacteria bacterium]|nr:HAD-IC family P-type ATPase [Candidatus Saccharibacteria bacterium]
MQNNSVWKIIRKHTFTLFNLVNVILALMVASVGSFKNLLFINIAFLNTLIGIINEVRAKHMVDKLRLISDKPPIVIRNGKETKIPAEEVVKGDIVVLKLGDQILFDSVLKEGTIEVNESFVTGEQDNITKHAGDKLISGSFVVSGSCTAMVEHVGDENLVNKLEKSAHVIKTADSKLFTLMNNIVKYISYTLIPIGALLLWARFRVPDTTTETAVISTVAGLITMIPEGLILLTSSVLALATIRLSRQKVLVQDLYSIETLARVDCICLDKTGTLTTGKMKVKDYIVAEGAKEDALLNALELILGHVPSDNATSRALHQKFLKTAKIEATGEYETIPFSSDRKYSGIKNGSTEYLMGALEFMSKNKSYLKEEQNISGSFRIISVIKRTKDKETLLGFVRLEDEIRKDANNIIKFFYDNDVAIKIISGDNLETVTKIAETVGVIDRRGVDLSTVKDPNFNELVKDYAIFTRVTPAQKKALIKALRKQGYTVAMTGDGVNDILAMKEADCSISIGEGSDAARRASKLVLLDSDFSAVPSIIAEGRQSINNLERSTSLFLSKTVYASILAVAFVFLPFEYPYIPIEMTLISFCCIGFPGLVLALEKNTARIKNRFIKNIKHYSIPTGVIVAISMITLSIIAHFMGLSRTELNTYSAIITFVICFFLLYNISRPLNLFRGALLLLIVVIAICALTIPFAREIFEFAPLF